MFQIDKVKCSEGTETAAAHDVLRWRRTNEMNSAGYCEDIVLIIHIKQGAMSAIVCKRC